jgi:hypothetical protein
MTSCRTLSKKNSEESDNPRFYGQKKFFLITLLFGPWAVLATWLYIGAPQKIHKK